MRKSKLAIGLMTAILSVGALGACSDVTYDENGVILTYTGEDGTKIEYTADDLFNDEFKDASNYQVVFDAVYKLIVKNYFNETDPDNSEYGSKQLAGLKTKAQVAVDGDKQTASKKAESNGTSYDTEFSAILSEKGVEDEDELFDHYLYTYEEETFNDNFEKIDTNMKILKSGTASITDPEKAAFYEDIPWDGYFAEKVPYHVSHILVKIEDADSTNYANAVISQANAKKLYKVANSLAVGDSSFADTATVMSDDSAARGDLGLVDMDKTATYIDEFKFAVYAFENLYGKTAEAKDSKISMYFDGTKWVDNYNLYNHLEEDEHAKGFATIPYGAFQVIDSNSERELGALDQKVHDGDVNFYPRNVFFNHYLNRHSLALVTPETASKTFGEDAKYYDVATGGTPMPATLGTLEHLEGTGFHNFTAEDGYAFTGTYLATSVRLGDKIVYRPILVVRGGSAGEGGYQGIHFIVVNRSPFEYIDGVESAHLASLEQYYTTYFPEQDLYPTYTTAEGKVEKLQTYVNFSKNKDTYQSRAQEVLSAIKGYDADGLKHFMFKKYLKAGKLAFNDADFAAEFFKWMERSEQNKEYNNTVEWENKWISYIENLRQAVSIQKNKTISKTCAIYYSNQSATPTGPHGETGGDAAWNEIGGYCNDGQKHN